VRKKVQNRSVFSVAYLADECIPQRLNTHCGRFWGWDVCHILLEHYPSC